MAFICLFERPSSGMVRPGTLAAHPEARESEMVAISLACEMLAETDARFIVGGFGEDDWRLDVWYDLAVFLEQISDALRELNQGNECEIDLYSQGVQRALKFHPSGDAVAIECISSTEWTPDPAVEDVGSKKLFSMLEKVIIDYSRAVQDIDNEANLIEPFSRWSQGVFW
jgi:hypothetical protein